MGYRIAVGTVGSGLWVSYDSGREVPPHPERHRRRGQLPGAGREPARARPDAGDGGPRRGVPIGRQRRGVDARSARRSPPTSGRWRSIRATPTASSSGPGPASTARPTAASRSTSSTTSIPERCPIGVPRTTNIVVDPADGANVWASVEVAGVHRSTDGGETWTSLGRLGPSEFHDDVHGFTCARRVTRRQLVVTTPYGLARSDDDGASWTWREFDSFPGTKSGIAYCRCVRAPWNDGTVIVCVGDYIPGAVGRPRGLTRRRRHVEARRPAHPAELHDVLAGRARRRPRGRGGDVGVRPDLRLRGSRRVVANARS